MARCETITRQRRKQPVAAIPAPADHPVNTFPATGRTVVRPEGTHPGTYAMTVVGDCMAPTIPDGATIIVEPIAPAMGDIAAIFFRDGSRPIVKRLLSDFDPAWLRWSPKSDVFPIIFVEQINPPQRYMVPSNKVERVDRFHSVAVIEPSASVPNAMKAAAGVGRRRKRKGGAA